MKKTMISALVLSAATLGLPAVAGFAPAFAAAPAVAGLPDFADLVERVGPAVVNIRTTERITQRDVDAAGQADEMQEFLRRFFGGQMPRGQSPRRRNLPVPGQEIQRGIGSGFVVSADGYVLTNAHVVDGADEVYVTLTDKREFKAKVLGADARADVAVLKIDSGGKLPYLTMGDPNKARVGEWVIAIGSPFNLENTVTSGIISAKARDTGDLLPLIQSDVAVNPGNSGGPLINMKGEVIGINSQIATLSGGYNGISFAIPIDEAMRVADQLKKSGRVTRGRLGVQIGELNKDVAESLGLKNNKGAEVTQVESGSPADKAGVRVGDVVIKYNGKDIDRFADLTRMVLGTAPGTKSTLTVWRKGAPTELHVTVGEADPDNKVAGKSGGKKGEKKSEEPASAANALGFVVSDLTPAQKRELGVTGGVIVEDTDGPAEAAGLRQGDILLMLNNQDIVDAKQFNAAVAKLDPKKAAAVLVRRGNQAQHFSLRPVAPAK
ncbi:Do family serine endopeptidase [Pseudoduganella eburnea]|uniref:Probable periplasmic serine endoprotease DegP-like n=1 Tax=Massilia eburnea TaxID=1776165 RepID=A0A6L6QGD3_9BURK|nr:DegQ family serine endoprotease [Massilia eburnea]MTW11170.1 Do family serine endopeptidase [Massilia eburnea]